MAHGVVSSKEAVVLGLLDEHGELYGLELVTLSRGSLKRGSVYVTLGRMEDKGLVRRRVARQDEPHSGLPRPRYRLTALGARALEASRIVHKLTKGFAR